VAPLRAASRRGAGAAAGKRPASTGGRPSDVKTKPWRCAGRSSRLTRSGTEDAIIYELRVRVVMDSNGERHRGLSRLTSKLDYLQTWG